MGRDFLDTNVLLYAADAAPASAAKRRIALEVVRAAVADGTGTLSTQVLQEFFVGATRKLGIRASRARTLVETFAAMEVVVVRPDMILGATHLHETASISFWDALIVTSAAEAGCQRLISEDLQDGRAYDGVRVHNPFK